MNLMQKNFKGINPVFQNQSASNTSDKYGFISSEKIIKFFENKGFNLDGVSYAKTKKDQNQGFQKHLMVFSRPDLLIDNGNKVQILALNSHDASQSFRLNLGIFRAVCANGIVSGDTLHEQRIIHIGNFNQKLNESLNYIVNNSGTLKDQVNAMKNTKLDFETAKNYLIEMAKLRLNKVENIETIDLASIDRIRRADDKSNDLYTFFNRVQESVIKGGIKYTTLTTKTDQNNLVLLDQNGKPELFRKNNTTRKITNFKASIDLNKTLFNEALKLVA